MSKVDLEKMLIKGIEDKEQKNAIVERILELEDEERIEKLNLIRSVAKGLESIDGILDITSEHFTISGNINDKQL